jgi:hypothetical protein
VAPNYAAVMESYQKAQDITKQPNEVNPSFVFSPSMRRQARDIDRICHCLMRSIFFFAAGSTFSGVIRPKFAS